MGIVEWLALVKTKVRANSLHPAPLLITRLSAPFQLTNYRHLGL